MRFKFLGSLFIVFISWNIFSSAKWVIRKFGEVTYERIMFHLHVPINSEITLVISFFQNTLMVSLLIVLGLYFSLRKFKKLDNKLFIVSWVLLAASLVFAFFKLDVLEIILYKGRNVEQTTFYDEHYVNSKNATITLNDKKRNLVLIFMESMEATYSKTKNHDYFGHNLIPELDQLARENTHFSDNDDLGGAFQLRGADYTQSSLIAQICGIPLKLPINSSRYRPKDGYLPNVYCLYDLLKHHGYKQTFMIGTTKLYSGMDKLIETHGGGKLLDWNYYKVRDNLPNNKSVRGKSVRDGKLFEYAKEELLELSKDKEKPFVFTLMTMDTHFATEYFDEDNCNMILDDDRDNFKNIVLCSSKQLNKFVDWIKQQEFYDDTTIVMVGDHLGMNNKVFNDDMDRKIFNIFINDKVQPINSVNRKFTVLDIYPTIVEAIGFQLKDGRLGLGTSLYSGKETLLEKGYEIEYIEDEFDKHSDLYNGIIFGDVHK